MPVADVKDDGWIGVPGPESARRTVELLLAFSHERPVLSARQLAEITGMPVPSVYRYVATLKAMALLIGDDRGGFRLSLRFVGLARAAEAADDFVDVAAVSMAELAAQTGETVLLTRLVNEVPVCVHRIESTHRHRISFEPGDQLSLERGATARIMLGALPEERRAEFLARLAESDRTRAEALDRAVRLAGVRGWAESEEEVDPGIWAIAAAIVDAGRVVAALSVPVPIARTTRASRREVLALARAAAARVDEELAERSRAMR